jgi:hypothetical protein
MTRDGGRVFGGRELLVLAGLLATAFVLRALLIAEETARVAPEDLRGFLSDGIVSLFLLALLVWTSRVSRILASLLVAAWVFLHFANYETVRELGAPASALDIGFLGDRTFLLGSATAVSRPVLLAVLLAASVGCGRPARASRRGARRTSSSRTCGCWCARACGGAPQIRASRIRPPRCSTSTLSSRATRAANPSFPPRRGRATRC